MLNHISTADILVFFFYFILVSCYGYFVYRRKRNETNSSSHSFFLAEGSLTWWAIGASIIASNISAEQFIGMSGDGFFAGIAVAVYEWVGAAALIIVAVFFMPVYIKNKIFTMPQFLQNRYNSGVALVMSIFWLFLYVFINLTAILYLGAIAINSLLGGEYFHWVMVGLAIFGAIIALGGMRVVGYTDVIQVGVLVVGGLAITYLSLTIVSQKFGFGTNALTGFNLLLKDSPDHFHLIFKKPAAGASTETITKYLILPGFAMYVSGQWISNLNYWGCNQYITQRALGANITTARTGILFASMLKILMPVIVMLPGIVAFVLYKHGHLPELGKGGKDGAYSAILSFLPSGLKGLSLAVLTAAIVASLAGKVNSIATIFTLDVYKNYLNKNTSERRMVWVGRAAIVVSLLISILFTWTDVLGISSAGGYTFVQKYSSFVSPGVLATFLLGMFWKRTTAEAAIIGILTGFAASVFFNQFAVQVFGPETLLYSAFHNASGQYEIPFFISLSWSFLITLAVMVVVSLKGKMINAKAIVIESSMFKLKPSSVMLIAVILVLLSAIYIRFW
ncbi:sodium:solute symporter family transporter [Mucilaginibacter pocheonensis]|uniref:SSS family solute:Na+ symporter n=1 Tax=Mucilaginibacter pocheonensis TaxID=398050 RepID=A0ABU1TDP7_9SPHI|nr:sodium/solute symporter [Mucilaginibacter pocheonensis]MDR6943487.1 SSS family solute:Na+ symporter [Mucilaginibacter pocheonensis]